MGECEKVVGREKLAKMVEKVKQDFWVSMELLHKIANDMEEAMRKGLEDEESSPIKMLISFVDSLPTGFGKDMAKEVGKALEKQALDMRVTALLNDTVGTLAGGRFYNKNVDVAVILGTGMNTAYMEKSKNIRKPYGPPPESREMVINTEWGNYNSELLPLTAYDRELDRDSPNEKKQILEKMLSGRNLGEIVHKILLHLAKDAALFEPRLFQLCIMTSADLSLVGKYLEDVLEIPNVSLEKKRVVVEICEIVAMRGARLSAAAILSILKRLGKDKMHEEKTVIAVDGSLFGKYQQFKSCLENTLLKELLDDEVSKMAVLEQFKDASGVGAALIAASHSSNNRCST